MKTILAIIATLIVVIVTSLETFGLTHTDTLVFTAFIILWVLLMGLLYRDDSSKGKPALPEQILKVGSRIKIAHGDFYTLLSVQGMHVVPVFILDLKKPIDWGNPTYIKFASAQLCGDDKAHQMRAGYNYIWNGEKLISATE